MKHDDIVNFFSEVGFLKRLKHNGLTYAGVKDPDTIAEHSFRTAIIGYILADMEGANKDEVALMCLFHDLPEARIGDQNKVQARYFHIKEAEMQALKDQLSIFPKKFADEIQSKFDHFEKRDTREGIVAKDADWLETALTAKEYLEAGYSGAQRWIDNVEKALETKSAKEILKKVKKIDFTNCWYQDLKTMTYKKLDK